jgi:hypothetical protein
MFDKQHMSSGVYLPGSNPLRKIRQEPSGFPAVGSRWNIAAKATPSSRASDPIPGSGASGWTTRPSNPAMPRRGRPQRIPSYGWSIRRWRSSRNRQPTRVLWAAQLAGSKRILCCGESARHTFAHSGGTNPHVPRDEFGLAAGEFLHWKIHFSFW